MSSATKSPVDRTMDTIPDTGDSGRKSAMSSASNKDRREKEIEWNLDQTSAPPQGTTRDSTTGTDVVNNDMAPDYDDHMDRADEESFSVTSEPPLYDVDNLPDVPEETHEEKPVTRDGGERSQVASRERLPSRVGRVTLSRTTLPAESEGYASNGFYSTGEESSVLITELQTQLPEEKVRDWGGLEIPLATHQVALQPPQDSEGDDDICSDDWDTELEDEEEPPPADHDITGRTSYASACEEYGVVPVSYFARHITDTELCMRYHGLGAEGTKAIAKVLKANMNIERLNLSGNWMEGLGGAYMAAMLTDNDFITHLILSDNKLGAVGAEHLTRTLQSNINLRVLDLSGNDFTDREAHYFADVLEENKCLRELNLSHNHFGEDGEDILGTAIGSNEILERLDLSWNKLRHRAAIGVAKGLKENVRLKWVNLSYNGFGSEGGKALGDAIGVNETLVSLDISSNRLDRDSAVAIAAGLKKNEQLTTLKVGRNPLTTAGCIHLAKALNESENSGLCILDLKDVPVEYEFRLLTEQIRKRRDLRVTHGLLLRSGNTLQDISKRQVDPALKVPLMILQEHIVLNDAGFLDTLRQQDIEQTGKVTHAQFTSALQNIGANVNSEVSQAIKNICQDDGLIDYGVILQQMESGRKSRLKSSSRTSSRTNSSSKRRTNKIA